MNELAAFLTTYGGWGVAVIALIALIFVDRRANDLLEKRHDEFVTVLEETSETFASTTAALNKVSFIAERLESNFKDHESLMQEVRIVLDNCREKSK